MYTILGVNTSAGQYEGHDYNKIKLYCQGQFDAKWTNAVGVSVDVISVDAERMQTVIADLGGNLKNLLGKQIDVYYNRYGKPDKIVLNK